MKKELKKKTGRPRNKKGVISGRAFVRAGIAMSAYGEARENGEKHSVSVKQSVKVIKQRHPKISISETGVRRILSQYRPRRCQTILLFERSPLTERELATHNWILQQLAGMAQQEGLKVPARSDVVPAKPVMTYKMRFGERPNYPRHNRKPFNG